MSNLTERVAGLSDTKRELLARMARQAGVEPPKLAPELYSGTIVPLRASGTKRPLFIIHATDGSVGYFRYLLPYLGEDRPVFAIQSPGLGGNPTYQTIEEQAAHYIEEMKKVDRGPHLIAGYCMGGLPAYEMGQQLLRRGEKPAGLVHISPIMERDWDSLDAEKDLELRAAHDFVFLADKLMGIRLPIDFDGLRKAPDRLAYLLDQAMQHNALPSDVEVDGFRQRLNVYRANLNAMRTYTPRDVQRFPLTVLLITLRGEGARLEFNSVYTAYLSHVPAEDISVTRVHADPVGMINGTEPGTSISGQALRQALELQ